MYTINFLFANMKTLKNILLLFILVLPHSIIAQTWAYEVNELKDYLRVLNVHADKVTDIYKDIEGNPYYFEDFKEGAVITKDNRKFTGVLRYDLYADEMEFKINEDIYWIAYPVLIEYLKIEDHVFMYFDKDIADSKKGHYFEVLVMGDCKLLLRKGVNLKEAEEAKPYTDPKPAIFIDRKDLFYLQKGIAYPTRITNKKSIEDYLSDKSQEVSKFMKKNKISAGNKSELTNLIQYYNSL